MEAKERVTLTEYFDLGNYFSVIIRIRWKTFFIFVFTFQRFAIEDALQPSLNHFILIKLIKLDKKV